MSTQFGTINGPQHGHTTGSSIEYRLNTGCQTLGRIQMQCFQYNAQIYTHTSQQNGHAEQFMYTVMVKIEACISAFSIAHTKLYSTDMSCEKHHIPSPVVQILSTTLHNSIPKHDFYIYGPENLVFCIPVASCSCSFLFRTGCGLVDFQMRQKTRMDWT